MRYTIKVHQSDKKVIDFRYECEHDDLPLSLIMNYLLFDPVQSFSFDGNFISKYSPQHKRFQYFIQRLSGIALECEENPHEGKQWLVYINETKYEWDEICEKEVKVKPTDALHFHYE